LAPVVEAVDPEVEEKGGAADANKSIVEADLKVRLYGRKIRMPTLALRGSPVVSTGVRPTS
jgi:hypothetical protein